MMAILDPVKLVIDNYPEGQTEMLERSEQPGESGAWLPHGSICAESFTLSVRTFMEEPPQQILPSVPRQ